LKSREEIIAFARESLGIARNAEDELIAFEGRGSDRAYYRFRWSPDNSTILVCYELNRIENAYYADIAQFLIKSNIPVPDIIRHDAANRIIIMRDLGDTDLWSLRNESWEVRRILYQKTLRVVHKLHSFPEALFPSDHVRLTEAFGPDLYRWERDYFRDNFISGFCTIHLESDLSAQLETELAGLADRLSSGRRNLVHRDLQSQNVMVYRNEPYLIDFQGMRFGTRFYDLGSILCDPYVNMSTSERKELLLFYYELSEQDLDWQGFQKAFWEASAQRLMQALGAYGFLGIKKGLKNYLVHIPAAIRNLSTAAENAASLPTLLKICSQCESALVDS
jgi:N-acetylmuramate 1-kinase